MIQSTQVRREMRKLGALGLLQSPSNKYSRKDSPNTSGREQQEDDEFMIEDPHRKDAWYKKHQYGQYGLQIGRAYV